MTIPSNDVRAASVALSGRAAAAIARCVAVLVLGLLPGTARADEASRFETLGCAGFACADTFKLRCPQASSMMCLTIESGAAEGPSAPSFVASAIATAPSSMLGSARVVQLPGSDERFFCLLRPGAEGTIRALLTVAVTGSGPSPVTYTARAQCYSGNVFDGLVSRDTRLAIKQDQ
ncbi:hypothetical protein K2Z84_28220 [Candidatus Binatia bacterium]|nr:hypothetical protein [Candidatus Binatia bacterium]